MNKDIVFGSSIENFVGFDPADIDRNNEELRYKMAALIHKGLSSQLTKRQRECLEMYYIQGLTMDKISKKIGINQSTVSRHVHAAIKNLEKLREFV